MVKVSRAHFVTVFLLVLTITLSFLTYSAGSIFAANQVPFEGMKLVYYSETTPTFLTYTGTSATGWVTLQFHSVTPPSSLLDIHVNGTVTAKNGQQTPIKGNLTVTFPTNQDTLVYLRNGGQQNLFVYAGPVGQSFQIASGYSFNLTRPWNLMGDSTTTTPLGTFKTYRYHTSQVLGSTVLDFYAYYDKATELLVYGEVSATQGAFSAVMEKITLQQENVQFTSTAQTPQCIIATAAYGSELAPPVQFLRAFRDQDVQKTYLGSSFVSAFNAWYYSWAPAIAQLESRSSGLRTVVRATIMPLLGALILSASIFARLEPANPELGVLISGIAASALIGLVYLTPFVFIIRRVAKRKFTAKTILYVSMFGVALTLLGTVLHGSVGVAQNLTALIVIETMLTAPSLLILTCKE